MTRWLHPPELHRADERERFDPVIDGGRHGLSRDVSLAIWERARADAVDRAGRRDDETARRRFRELVVRVAARGGRLQPDVGRVTRVATELDRESERRVADEFRARHPGRETLVAGADEPRPPDAAIPARSVPAAPARDAWLTALPAAVMRSAEHAVRDLDAAERALRALRGGAPLDAALRARLEAALGTELGDVRVHTGGDADAAARALGARAFAIRNDIFFRNGTYDPRGRDGQRLIAHEVAHTVQVRGAGTPPGELEVSRPDDASEREADAFADAFITAPSAPVPDHVQPMTLRAVPAAHAAQHTMVLRDDTGEAAGESEEVGSQLLFANLGPRSMHDIVARLEAADAHELTVLRKHSALAEPYGRERLELAMNVIWYAKYERSALSTMRPKLMADIDRIVPQATHADQYDELVTALDRQRAALPPDAVTVSGGKRGPSAGKSDAPSEETMKGWRPEKLKKWQGWLDTRDEQAQRFGAADYADYVANMLVSGGSVFGRSISPSNPVHPLFLDRLEKASAAAQAAIGSNDFGVRAIAGQDNRPGNHAWGIAVDIDADSNPYIINEAQDVGVDERVAAVYSRIANSLLHRESLITKPVTATKKKSGLDGASYTQIAEESDAMVAYFSILPVAPPPAPAKGKGGAAPLPAARKLTGVVIDPAAIAALDPAQVQADYNILVGKGERKGVAGDFPFEGAGAATWRDPKRGFMSLRKEVVDALRDVGLRWGASDFSGASGDVMHFDDDKRKSDYETYGRAHRTGKRGADSGAK